MLSFHLHRSKKLFLYLHRARTPHTAGVPPETRNCISGYSVLDSSIDNVAPKVLFSTAVKTPSSMKYRFFSIRPLIFSYDGYQVFGVLGIAD